MEAAGAGLARAAGGAYDSRERRQQMAAELDEIADRETVQARVLADTSQARPAAEATWTASSSSAGAAAARQRQPQRAPGPMNLSERLAAAKQDRG
jgi:conjugal transfer/entry exclusion protein